MTSHYTSKRYGLSRRQAQLLKEQLGRVQAAAIGERKAMSEGHRVELADITGDRIVTLTKLIDRMTLEENK